MASSCRLAATIHPVFQRAAREALTDTNRQTTLAALPFMGVEDRGAVMADEGRTDVDVGRVDVDEGGTNVVVGKADDVVGRTSVVVGKADVVVCKADDVVGRAAVVDG